jgi:hypothetical protein
MGPDPGGPKGPTKVKKIQVFGELDVLRAEDFSCAECLLWRPRDK